jgi:hypothetical protein
MPNIADVKAALARGDHACHQASKVTEGLAAAIGDHATAARATTHDSHHQQVETGHARLHEARREADIVLRRLSEAREGSQRYRGTLG